MREKFFSMRMSMNMCVFRMRIKKGCRPVVWGGHPCLWSFGLNYPGHGRSIGAFQNPCVLEVGAILRANGIAALFGLSFGFEAGDDDAEHALLVFAKDGGVAFVLHAFLEGECVGAVLKAADYDAVELDGIGVFTLYGGDFLLSCLAGVFRLGYGGDLFVCGLVA